MRSEIERGNRFTDVHACAREQTLTRMRMKAKKPTRMRMKASTYKPTHISTQVRSEIFVNKLFGPTKWFKVFTLSGELQNALTNVEN